jgi:predicted nucleic acid-binding protein
MTRYLFDSDAIIDFLGGVPATVALFQRLERQGDALCTCDVVVAEVYAGLLPEDRPRGERLLAVLVCSLRRPIA